MTIPPIHPEPQPDEERPIADPDFGATQPVHGSGPMGPDAHEEDEPAPLPDPEDVEPHS